MTKPTDDSSTPLGLVWLDSSYPVVSVGLQRILRAEAARVHIGREPPKGEAPSLMVLATRSIEGVSEEIKRAQKVNPRAPIIVLGLSLDLALAKSALSAGARGFIHAGMTPKQIRRAFEVISEGEIVAPRQLLEYLIVAEEFADLDMLSARQREILELVDEGLTNAQIAKRLFLSESSVKQHLRRAYKVLGVRNRAEAAKLVLDATRALRGVKTYKPYPPSPGPNGVELGVLDRGSR